MDMNKDVSTTFDFNNIQNDMYYAFGGFVKNGKIDFKRLADEIEEVQYYLAMMKFEVDDVTFNIRLLPYSPAKWLFESDNEEDAKKGFPSKEDFDAFVKTETFKKFAAAIPNKMKEAFGALSVAKTEELKNAGINKEDVDKVLNSRDRLLTIAVSGAKNPKMKEI